MVAGIIQMDPVNCQDAGFFVAGVIPQIIGMKGLAQVHQAGMEFLCQVTDDLGVGIEVAVLLVGKVGFFADDGRGHEEQAHVFVEKFIDDSGIELLEFVGVCTCAGGCFVPDVVDAHPDKGDIGVLCQRVVVHPEIKVIYLIAADACADEVIVRSQVFFIQSILHSDNIATGFCTQLGYGVTKKDHFLGLWFKGSKEGHTGQKGEDGAAGSGGGHGDRFYCGVIDAAFEEAETRSRSGVD